MLKIEEENSITVKTRVQQSGNTLFVYLPKVLRDQGMELMPGQDLELCLDRKAKVVYFKYGFGEQ